MAINKVFDLKSTDPWSAIWTYPNHEVAYTAEAWGVHRGQGRGAKADEGNTVTCRANFLLELLRSGEYSLLMLIKLELFIEKNRYGGDDEGESRFVHTWVTAVIDQNGNVKVVKPTEADRKVVEILPDQDRFELSKRYNALSKALKS